MSQTLCHPGIAPHRNVSPGTTVRAARLALERARASYFLSDFDSSTALLQSACNQLATLLPAHWLTALSPDGKSSLQHELQLLASEMQHAQTLHNHASGLMAGWAQLFAEATGLQPAAGYRPGGLADMVAPRSFGNHEWEA